MKTYLPWLTNSCNSIFPYFKYPVKCIFCLKFYIIRWENSYRCKLTIKEFFSAQQYLDINHAQLKPASRFYRWKDTTVDEIRAFFALVHQQDIQDYWPPTQYRVHHSSQRIAEKQIPVASDISTLYWQFILCASGSWYDPFYSLGSPCIICKQLLYFSNPVLSYVPTKN